MKKLQHFSKASIVELILSGEVNIALNLLSKKHNVEKPKLKVGLPKGCKTKRLGCYNTKQATITVYNRDGLTNPYLILHEFYHHIRTNINKKHLGTEKYANKFAQEYLLEYNQEINKQIAIKNSKDYRKQK